jgi:hypothetical protein
MQIIIYKNSNGGVSVIYPITDSGLPLEQIALKDVPAGSPFKILDITDLPLDGTLNELGIPNIDKTFRDQWDVEEADLTDGEGADYGVGSDWVIVDYDNDGVPDYLRNELTGEMKRLNEEENEQTEEGEEDVINQD